MLNSLFSLGEELTEEEANFLITDPHRIGNILASAAAHHAHLAVKLPKQLSRCSSVMLAVDIAARRVALDDPWPTKDRVALHAGDHLLIQTRVDGAEVRLDLEIERIFERKGGPVVQCLMPKAVWYRQQRSNFRISIADQNAHCDCVIRDADGAEHHARVVDVSVSGFGALLEKPPNFKVGDELHCELTLDGHALNATAELRSLVTVKERDRVGMLFKKLPPDQQRVLDREVARLQRQRLNRK